MAILEGHAHAHILAQYKPKVDDRRPVVVGLKEWEGNEVARYIGLGKC